MTKIYIGAQLRAVRDQLQLTKAEVARRIDCSASYLTDIENNRLSPGVDFVHAMYTQLDINPIFLMTGNGPVLASALTAGHPPDALHLWALEAQVQVVYDTLAHAGALPPVPATDSLTARLRDVERKLAVIRAALGGS